MPTTATRPAATAGDRIRLTASGTAHLRTGMTGVVVAVMDFARGPVLSVRWDEGIGYGDAELALAHRWGDRWEVIR